MSRRRKPSLVTQYLEDISREALENHEDIVRQFVRRRIGIYALYRRGKLYYTGLASNLRSRLKAHLKDPPPHFHPNEEQFLLVLEGRMKMVVGDEERIVEPGFLVHIPRNTRHGVCAIGGPAVFFAAKSPVGTGDMAQDYNKAKDADEVWKRLST